MKRNLNKTEWELLFNNLNRLVNDFSCLAKNDNALYEKVPGTIRFLERILQMKKSNKKFTVFQKAISDVAKSSKNVDEFKNRTIESIEVMRANPNIKFTNRGGTGKKITHGQLYELCKDTTKLANEILKHPDSSCELLINLLEKVPVKTREKVFYDFELEKQKNNLFEDLAQSTEEFAKLRLADIKKRCSPEFYDAVKGMINSKVLSTREIKIRIQKFVKNMVALKGGKQKTIKNTIPKTIIDQQTNKLIKELDLFIGRKRNIPDKN